MKRIACLLAISTPAWAGYSYCQPLVVQHAKVANSDQSSYVLTVNDTDPGLASVSSGGYVRNSNGFDIAFASDNQGQHLLTWDPLEFYNPATGQIVAHVQLGPLSHTADTTIYRCAGNAGTSVFQGG